MECSVVDRVRTTIEGNRRPSKVNERFYTLSGGVLRCGGCGRAMQTYWRKTAAGGYKNYYRCRPSVGPDACPNRKSHEADALEYEAVFTFERYASRGALLDLFGRARAEQERRTGLHAALERRAALSERLSALAKMSKGLQDQHAEGLMTLAELRERLMELDEEKAAISDEVRAEDATEAKRRLEAAGLPGDGGLARRPDRIQPHEFLTLGATQEEIRRAYNWFGARFTVDAIGVLSLTLSLEGVGKSLQEKRTF